VVAQSANPPKFFDLPTRMESCIPKSPRSGSPFAARLVDQYVPNLKKYRSIAMDVGDMDNADASTNRWTKRSRGFGWRTLSRSTRQPRQPGEERSNPKCCPSFEKSEAPCGTQVRCVAVHRARIVVPLSRAQINILISFRGARLSACRRASAGVPRQGAEITNAEGFVRLDRSRFRWQPSAAAQNRRQLLRAPESLRTLAIARTILTGISRATALKPVLTNQLGAMARSRRAWAS